MNTDPSKVYIAINAADVQKYINRGWKVESVSMTMSIELEEVSEDIVEAIIDRPRDVTLDNVTPLRIVSTKDEGGKTDD
jgi:hypothetical protein